MKKAALVLVGLVLVVGLAVTAPQLLARPSATPSTSPTVSGTASQTSPDDPGVPEGAQRASVAYVHDGDTLFLQPDGTSGRAAQIKVRLLGIDTPELDPEECFGSEARAQLRQLLPEGASVWTIADAERFDQYGRSLLYLWSEQGSSINLELVSEGYARVMIYEPNTAYETELRDAEEAAQNSGVGLWTACDTSNG